MPVLFCTFRIYAPKKKKKVSALKLIIHKCFDKSDNKSIRCVIQPVVVVSHAVEKRKKINKSRDRDESLDHFSNTSTIFLTFSRLPSFDPFLSFYSVLSSLVFLYSLTHQLFCLSALLCQLFILTPVFWSHCQKRQCARVCSCKCGVVTTGGRFSPAVWGHLASHSLFFTTSPLHFREKTLVQR